MRMHLWIASTLILLAAAAANAQKPPDPIGEALFPPDLVMQHQQALGLSAEQRESLKNDMRQAQIQFTELQWKLQDEVEQMAKLLGSAKVDESKVSAQLDKVLAAEGAVKHRQIALLVRIKNSLSADQQSKLRELRTDGKPSS